MSRLSWVIRLPNSLANEISWSNLNKVYKSVLRLTRIYLRIIGDMTRFITPSRAPVEHRLQRGVKQRLKQNGGAL